MYDLIIVGGGPAAVAAGVYAARKKLQTLVVTESFESQSFVSDKIENWIGEISISGFDLAQKLEAHLRAQETIEVKTGERVEKKQTRATNIAQNRLLLFPAAGGAHLGFPEKKNLWEPA